MLTMQPTRQRVTLETLQDTGDLPILGYTVSWKLTGVQIPHTDLVARLEAAGFGDQAPRREPPEKRAVKRAIRAWVDDRRGLAPRAADDETGSGSGRRRSGDLIRVINDRDSAFVVYALVAEDADVQELALEYSTAVRFSLNKTTGELFCTTEARGQMRAESEAQEIARQIAPHWNYHKGLQLSGDVARIVTAAVQSLDAVTLRDQGGLYFVPVQQQDALERLAALLADLPTLGASAPMLLMLPVINVGAAAVQLRQVAEEDMLREIEAAGEDLSRFNAGTVKRNTVMERLAAFARLKDKIALYAETVGMRRERLDVDMARLEAQVRALLPDEPRQARLETPDGGIDLGRLGGTEPTRQRRVA